MGDTSAGAGRSDVDDEAEKIWLARIAAAPNSWRSRAASAGGLLSAAAAASLAGLLARPATTYEGLAKVTILAAAVLYVAAVISLLSASVWPSPKHPAEETDDYAGRLTAYCEKEAGPIRRAVIAGSILGALAVASTAVGAAYLVTKQTRTAAYVGFSDPEVAAVVKRLCPKLREPLLVQLEELQADHVAVLLPAEGCVGAARQLLLARSAVTVLTVPTP